MKKRLLNGESIDLTNENDQAFIWFSKDTKHFCLMFNAKCIAATKTFGPIQKEIDKHNLIEA